MGRYDAINPGTPKKESFLKKFINEAVLLKKLDQPIKIAPQPTPGNNPASDRSDALVQTYPYYGGYQGAVGLTGAQGYTGAQGWTGGYTGVQGWTGIQGLTGAQPPDDIQIRVYENGDLTRELQEAARQRVPDDIDASIIENIVRSRQTLDRSIRRRVAPQIIQADEEREQPVQGPRSQLLTIMGPFGFRIMIPIRHLNYQIRPTNYTNEMELTIRMSANESRSLVNDIEAAMGAYGITSVVGGPRRRT